MSAVAVVLAVTQTLTLVLLAVLLLRLRRAKDEVESVRGQLLASHPTRARTAAGWAVRQVTELPARVRERGVVGGLLMAPIEDLTRLVLEDRAELAKVTAPDGTVALLFSDIADSTSLNERLGDTGWVHLLQEHDRLVRRTVDAHHGHVVKSQGDGFMIAFADPEQAVLAALDIQTALRRPTGRLRRTPIQIRIGVHCGPVVSREGDYFGLNVALAARVAACADGGEVLVTDAVRESVDPARCTFSEGLQVELKGLTGTHTLWLADAAS